MNNIEIKKILTETIPFKHVIRNAPMSSEVSFKAGGQADFLAIPQDEKELAELLRVLTDKDIPHMVMGNGSNLLIKDGGFRGVIIKITPQYFSEIEIVKSEKLEDVAATKIDQVYLVTCQSGTLMSTLAKFLQSEELEGFEFASGIPGSIGGAVFMNAGAYGGEMKDIIKEVTVITKDGKEIKKLQGDELDLGYRYSKLQKSGDVVISVTLMLKKGNKEEIVEKIKELNQKRNEKQPVNYPSAGSFFKRPEGHFAGKLIEDAGLKGYTVGGAQVSKLHSGFVINIGDATATDIINLMHHCQEEVKKQFGVELKPEVQILGEDL